MRGRLPTLSIAIGLVALQAAAASEELLKNPGFEDELAGWTATGTAQYIACHDWHAHESRFAFGIGNDEGPADAYGSLSQDVHLPSPLSSGTACTLSFYVLVEEQYTGRFTMSLHFLSAAGDLIEEAVEVLPVDPGRWRFSPARSVAPAGTQIIRVICSSERMRPGRGLSFLWLDNGSLKLE